MIPTVFCYLFVGLAFIVGMAVASLVHELANRPVHPARHYRRQARLARKRYRR